MDQDPTVLSAGQTQNNMALDSFDIEEELSHMMKQETDEKVKNNGEEWKKIWVQSKPH